MRFYSTNNKNIFFDFRTAVLRGLAPDGGLFMPERIPRLSENFFDEIHALSLQEISFRAASAILRDDIPENELHEIVQRALRFEIPLRKLGEDLFVLELFHGPTLSFKDIGARFMAEVVAYFGKARGEKIMILTATSGDTGSAVAQAFAGAPNVPVVILYPKGKVSEVQEQQIATLGGNICALEVEGAFDDCQRLVKQAFADKEIVARTHATSANSINVARLIPQTFYYFWAYAQLSSIGADDREIVMSVPSGNFGNLTAGLIAKQMGLPVLKFVAATNVNDIVPAYLRTGEFRPKPSLHTLSNAMDVGNPSNFARVLDLYHGDRERLAKDVFAASFTDAQTKTAMRDVNKRDNYVLEPHGAVGYLGLMEYRKSFGSTGAGVGIVFETAHPAKFPEVVREVTGRDIPPPAAISAQLKKKKRSIPMPNDIKALTAFLLSVAEK